MTERQQIARKLVDAGLDYEEALAWVQEAVAEDPAQQSLDYHLALAVGTIELLRERITRIAAELEELVEETPIQVVDSSVLRTFAEHVRAYAWLDADLDPRVAPSAADAEEIQRQDEGGEG